MRKIIKRVFWIYFLLFFLIAVNLIKFALFDYKLIILDSHNPRLKQMQNDIKTGDILDRNGELLVESIQTENGYVRDYKYPTEFSHVIGYSTGSKSGIELIYSLEMNKLNNEMFQYFDKVFKGRELKGNSISLTLDANLQSLCAEKLGKKKGAIVAMEPSTGKILAMVSYPNFNSQNLSKDWEVLRNDTENSPLLNRATQGLYPPGSIFKIITADAAINNMPDIYDFRYECRGEEYFSNNERIRCFNSTVHRNEDIKKAMSKSCNTFFATIGQEIGVEGLNKSTDAVLFNQSLNFPLEYRRSSFNLTEEDLIQTSIGQGKTLVTPLHMAMLTSAVANNGVMMQPYLVDHIQTHTEREKSKAMPQMLTKSFNPENTLAITEMLEDVVISGTAVDARISGVSVAGKTGTAEVANAKDHSWFVSFAPSENPEIVVVVLLENGVTGSVHIAREIIREYLK